MRFALNVQLTAEDITILDKILHATEFENRTDYITALLQTTIHGPAATPKHLPLRTGV